jgi:hypothetical protein
MVSCLRLMMGCVSADLGFVLLRLFILSHLVSSHLV